MTVVLRVRRPASRGPRRIAPREKPDAIAASMRLSKRTIYRYLAEVEPAAAQRIRGAIESWPDVELLDEDQREELIAWLYDALAGWHA